MMILIEMITGIKGQDAQEEIIGKSEEPINTKRPLIRMRIYRFQMMRSHREVQS
jgi:hypothetical protein